MSSGACSFSCTKASEERTSFPCFATWAVAGSAARAQTIRNSVRRTQSETRDLAIIVPLLGDGWKKEASDLLIHITTGGTPLPVEIRLRPDFRDCYTPPDPRTGRALTSSQRQAADMVMSVNKLHGARQRKKRSPYSRLG